MLMDCNEAQTMDDYAKRGSYLSLEPFIMILCDPNFVVSQDEKLKLSTWFIPKNFYMRPQNLRIQILALLTIEIF